jgi:SET and MYND domain-containing protein
MHLLEMAKTAWNAIVMGDNHQKVQVSEEMLKDEVRVYLTLCEEILGTFGCEGDTVGGPLEEIQTLHGLLQSD